MIETCRAKNSLFRSLRGAGARCLLAAIPLAVVPAAHAAYNLTFVLDPTNTGLINLLGINNSGTVAGFDNSVTSQAFRLTLPSSFTGANFPGATSSMATGINNVGDVSGIYVDFGGITHGFTEIGGVFTTVDDPSSAVFNQSLGINNSGQTVGYYAPTTSGFPGDVANTQLQNVFYNVDQLLPANLNSQAVGINSQGIPSVVGYYQPTLTTSFGFLNVGGVITKLDPFGSMSTQALGVNDLGEIVGVYTDAYGQQHGYIDNGGVFTSFDPSDSASTTINGLNDNGDIVGFYTSATSGSVIGFFGNPVGNPVPEPSTWAMMLAGFAGLGFLGFRKARRATLAN